MADTTAPAPSAPKIKTRKLRQRACDEKSPKGKLCFGHLKRSYDYPREIERKVGRGPSSTAASVAESFTGPIPPSCPIPTPCAINIR